MKSPVPFGLYWFAFTLAGMVALAIDPSTSYAGGTAADAEVRSQNHESSKTPLLVDDLKQRGSRSCLCCVRSPRRSTISACGHFSWPGL